MNDTGAGGLQLTQAQRLVFVDSPKWVNCEQFRRESESDVIRRWLANSPVIETS